MTLTEWTQLQTWLEDHGIPSYLANYPSGKRILIIDFERTAIERAD